MGDHPSPPTITTLDEPPSSHTPAASPVRHSWLSSLTLDLLISVLANTLFHPFLAALIPLCLRAQATPYNSTSFILTSSFAILVSVCHVFYCIDQRLAYGSARDMDWMHEVVVITGGKGGLGGVLAEVLGMRGVDIVVLDVCVTEEEEKAEEERMRCYKCDVGNAGELERVWGRVVSDVGTPTILINNAAISAPSPFLIQSPSEVSRLFAINTISHFTLTQLFLRTLLASSRHRRKGGHIVTVASVLGQLGAANLSAYTASKAALVAYHTSLSAELRQMAPSVKTILVAQGQLDTEMFREVKVRGWLQRFLGPVIGAQEVAMGIVKLLDQGKGGEVRLPAFAGLISWLFVLPVGVARLLRDFSGVDAVVDVGGVSGMPDGGEKEDKSVRFEDAESDSEGGSTDELAQ